MGEFKLLKTRVISGLILLVLVVAVVLSGQIVLGFGIFILSLIGINEFYNSVEYAGYKPIKIIGYIACVPIVFIGLNGAFRRIDNYLDLFKSINIVSFCVFLIIIVLFSLIIFLHDKYNLHDISLTIFGVFYVAFLFAFVILTRNLEGGQFYIWMVFIGAFATDTSAYFTGLLMGKTKLLPAISPKKTLEGAIGGIVGCVIVMVLYGAWLNGYQAREISVPLYHFALIGVLSGILSQIGDWAASAIKRYVKIKDYGNIMPGHGGVLDRFDSILFTAPVVYFYISFIINR